MPLDDERILSDLVRMLELPVLVIARAQLGTINHTLLTVRECRRQGIEVRGVVLTQTEPGEPDPSTRSNARCIRRYAEVPVLGEIPYLQDLREIDRHLDADALLGALVGERAGSSKSSVSTPPA